MEPTVTANRFNGFTEHGVGIGLRIPHYRHILERKPVVDWFEIISENFMVDGGRPLALLDQILEQYRVVQHGVSMYFGSADKPDRTHLRRLKGLVESDGGDICFVKLFASMEELKKRVVSPSRDYYGKLMSADELEVWMSEINYLSKVDIADSLEIDNTNISAEAVAESIKRHSVGGG